MNTTGLEFDTSFDFRTDASGDPDFYSPTLRRYHKMEIIGLARNNERRLEEIVINAFTKSFVVSKDLFEVIEKFNEESDN